MPLDPQARALLEQLSALALPPVTALSPAESRRQMEEATSSLGPPPAVARVEDRTIPGPSGPIPIRITAPSGAGPLPALVYLHGGGWVVGSIATHDGLCGALANAAGVAVVSVEYRLAPEHPFPAAVDDAYAATAWVAAHGDEVGIDTARVAVGGDSGGEPRGRRRVAGTRPGRAEARVPTACVSDHERRPRHPLVSRERGRLLPHPRGHGLVLGPVRAEPARPPQSSGVAAPRPDLSGLPPALVITAEYDPLRDEAEAYAARLAGAGVAVRLTRYPGMIHGFLRRAALLDQGKTALAECAEALRVALGS